MLLELKEFLSTKFPCSDNVGLVLYDGITILDKFCQSVINFETNIYIDK